MQFIVMKHRLAEGVTLSDVKRGMAMAFISKRNSEKSAVEGLSKVLNSYDEVVFYQKIFEGLLADYLPYAYAFKSRLILMGKSGDLKYFCDTAHQFTQNMAQKDPGKNIFFVGDAIQQVRKKADAFANYYHFEKQIIYHDVNLIFNALGISDPVLTTGVDAVQAEDAPEKNVSSHHETSKENLNHKTKPISKPSLPLKHKAIPVAAFILFLIMMGAGYGYLIYQFGEAGMVKILVRENMQRLTLENDWLVYGIGGVMGMSLITLILSLRFNKSVINILPWLVLSLQFGMIYFKIRQPMQYEWLECYIFMILASYGFMTTLPMAFYKRTTRKVMLKHMAAIYLMGIIYLTSQYFIRFTV